MKLLSALTGAILLFGAHGPAFAKGTPPHKDKIGHWETAVWYPLFHKINTRCLGGTRAVYLVEQSLTLCVNRLGIPTIILRDHQ